MDISNASLLDEPTAAAEAMMMAHRANRKNKSNKFLCDSNTHPLLHFGFFNISAQITHFAVRTW
jgi:glycine cleavage system pyridoxal-binding protein P